MHTLLVIVAGIALGAAFGLLDYLWGGGDGVAIAVRIFGAVCLIAAGINLWVGVTHAGYTIADELPIMGATFVVPVGLALLVSRAVC